MGHANGFFLRQSYPAIIAALIILLAANTTPATAVELQARNFHQDLASNTRYLEDKVNRLTPDQILQLDRNRDFKPILTKLIDFGFNRSRFWLRLPPLHNASGQDGTWKLSLDVPNLAEATVYQTDISGSRRGPLRTVFTVDDSMAFSQRGATFRNFVVDIELARDARAELLISYTSKQATQLPLFIESADQFYQRIRVEDLHNWAMFALLVGMTLVSTVYLAALGYRTAYYYAAYILLSGLYLFHTDGYAFQYLWPEAPMWNKIAVGPIGLALVASGSMFARSFIEAPTYHPLLNRVLIGVTTITLALLMISPWAVSFTAFKVGTLLFVVLCAALQVASGVLAMRRGQAGSSFFLAGAIAVVSSVLFGIIGYLNPGQFNQDIAGHSGRYALLCEGAAFSLAIFVHTQVLRRERDVALRREVAATADKLALSEALRSTEQRYSRAVELAESRREQMASTAHDFNQPLASLRIALMRHNVEDRSTAQQIAKSFGYLDNLIRTSLVETRPAHRPQSQISSSLQSLPNSHAMSEDNALEHDAHAEPAPDPAEQFEVALVLKNVTAMFADEAQRNGCRLTMIASTAIVMAAPVPLMRVLSNLVANAVKHTRDGRILIGCRRQGKTLRVEVHNSGQGMTDEQLSEALKPYSKADSSQGAGLGLEIIKRLAGQHQWQFKMSSKVGRGTIATIILPTGEPAGIAQS